MIEEENIDEIDEKLDKTEDYEIIINLLYQKVDLLESIIERKDRQIDLMADTILEDTLKLDTYWCNGCFKTAECPYKKPKDCIKQYFKKQVKEV